MLVCHVHSNEEDPQKGLAVSGPRLGHRRVGIVLLGAVEIGDFREMNFTDTMS